MKALCAEAARALGVPVAWVGLVRTDGEEVIAAHGSPAQIVPAESSLVMRVAGAPDVVVAGDLAAEAAYRSHPLVAGPPHLRFFAAAPLLDASDTFLGALCVVDRVPRTLSEDQRSILRLLGRQVSRELSIRETLVEAEERFRDFFEQTADLVMSLAPDGKVLHANETARRTLGIERGQALDAFAESDRRQELRDAIARAFETSSTQRVDSVFVTAGGGRITLEGFLQPKTIDGRPALARIIFRDVSDREQFESELGQARDAAFEASRLKTQFLTNVSHEIRTPMNGIVGMVDLLLATPLNVEQQDFAHQARASAEQLLSIVNNILYVSNLEAGTLSSSLVDFDLYRTLQRIVEVMEVAALGKEIDVSFTYDPALPTVFRGNPSKLRQVVSNLMDNALKFTEQGRVILSVSMQSATETHVVVRFDVRDSGIGIAEEDRLLLFERFLQIEGGSTRRFGGVGLGLSTAKQLVETMGGLIDVESTPGRGSTFWFTIPFPRAEQSARPLASSDLELKGKRVLLVDPHPTSRRVARHYLETTWEMRVDLAQTGHEALAKLRRDARTDPYRVVLYDYADDLNVMAFTRALRADPAVGGTSVIHLVSAGKVVNDEKLREAGVNAYVAKPVGQRELFDAISVALAHDAIELTAAGMKPSLTKPVHALSMDALRKAIRILLAEDNFLNMKLTMSQLQKLGFEADSVANGKEALEAVQERRYDVILMDCQMPVLDGYSATAEIRRRETAGLRRHYIIAMTANALEGDREKCLAAGMDDYLAKPTRGEELDRALLRFLLP